MPPQVSLGVDILLSLSLSSRLRKTGNGLLEYLDDIDKRDGASDVADYLRVRHLAVVSFALRAATSWEKRTPGQYSPAHNLLGKWGETCGWENQFYLLWWWDNEETNFTLMVEKWECVVSNLPFSSKFGFDGE